MPDTHQEAVFQLLEKSFSKPRMSPYLAETMGKPIEAVDLYVWNSEVTAEFWKLIGFTEVALRNTISIQLGKSATDPDPVWLDDRSVIRPDSDSFKKLAEAKANLEKIGKTPSITTSN